MMAKETHVCRKRGLYVWQMRPIYVAKETHICSKRDQHIWQNRPICMANEAYTWQKETFIPGINAGMIRKEACTLWIAVEDLKRDVYLWQKRPECVVKEAVCGSHFKVSPA